MKKLAIASVAALSLATIGSAFAQGVVDPQAGAVIGASGGTLGGAAIGATVGGPIGAIVGGFAGAVIGAEAGIETATVDYVVANPVDPIYIDGGLTVGTPVPSGITIYPVDTDPNYGYFYANDRAWIVDMTSQTVVQSPGYYVAPAATSFIVENPVASAQVQGDIVVGKVLPDGVTIAPVPDSSYGYVYINDQPVLVDNSSRTVVWMN